MTLCNLVGGYEGFGGTSSHHPQSQSFSQCADDRLKDRAISNSRTNTLILTVMQTTNLKINYTRTDVCRTNQTIKTFSGVPLKINIQNRISNEYESAFSFIIP